MNYADFKRGAAYDKPARTQNGMNTQHGVVMIKDSRVVAMLDKALSAGHITKTQYGVYGKHYDNDPEGLAGLLVSELTEGKQVSNILLPDGGAHRPSIEVQAMMILGWDKLDRSNRLASLKAVDPVAFAELHKRKFGGTPIALQSAKRSGSKLTSKAVQDMVNEGWDKLDRSNRLADLKKADPAAYAELYKKRFGRSPK